MHRRTFTVLALAWSMLDSGRAAAQAIVPFGTDFRVNTTTTGDQQAAAVASCGTGDFVVVWTSSDGGATGIFGKRFSSAGTPLGAEFRVNTYTTAEQGHPAVAGTIGGAFLVVWDSDGEDLSGRGVYGQRYSSAGAPQGSAFRVNTYTTNSQYRPKIASVLSGGDFVVAWSSFLGAVGYDVFARRYSSAGAELGGEFRVNTLLPASQFADGVAGNANGFIVSFSSLDGRDVFARRYDSTGVALGPEFRLNTSTTNPQQHAVVAVADDGSFLTAWDGGPGDGIHSDVFAQRFTSSGSPAGVEFRVNSSSTGYQEYPKLGLGPAGQYLVVWEGLSTDWDVIARTAGSAGGFVNAETRVNTSLTGGRPFPDLARLSAGRFVVAWQAVSIEGPGSGLDVRARRLGLSGDVNWDGAVNVGDVFTLINFIFAGGPAPTGPADPNHDDAVNVADVFYLINFIFAGGPQPI